VVLDEVTAGADAQAKEEGAKRAYRPLGVFLIKRIAQSIVVIWLVTIVVFGLLHSLPGGPARGILGIHASPAEIATFNKQQGFDKSLPAQYWQYLVRLLHFNLGRSYSLNESVAQLIGQRLPKTLVLTGLSTLVAIVIALPLGIWQAVRRRQWPDYVVTALAFIAYATPVYFLALILVIIFNIDLKMFPAEAPQVTSVSGLFTHFNAMVLPIASMTVATVAVFSRYIRSSVLDNLSDDYTRTARAKGASERRVVLIHILRNSLTPVITMLGYYLPVMFGGAIVVEAIFNFPGMGLLFWQAAQTSDYPVLLGVVLIISVATVVGSLLADILQAIVDPRVRASIR
jgi:peptide/nickel transport system permease protein